MRSKDVTFLSGYREIEEQHVIHSLQGIAFTSTSTVLSRWKPPEIKKSYGLGACRKVSVTAFSANTIQMQVAKGCCTWMGAFPLAMSLTCTLFLYSTKIHNVVSCIESFYRRTKSGFKNIGLNISFAANAATCNIHIVLECVYTGKVGSSKRLQPAVRIWDRLNGKSKRNPGQRGCGIN